MSKSAHKPKILVIGPTPPPYHGCSVSINRLLTRLPQDRFSLVHLDTADRRGLEGVGRLDFTNVYLAWRHGIQSLWLLLSQRPVMVYLPISQALLPFLRDCLFLIPSILLRRKVVVHLHGSIFRDVYQTWPRWARWLARFTLSRSSRAIVLCARLKPIFADFLPADRIVAVPNGIEARPAGIARAAWPRAVLRLGALNRAKGTLDILKAIPEVVRRCPDARFFFVGTWPHPSVRAAAESLIEENGLGRYVQLRDPVVGEEKWRLLQEIGVFVLPSYHEGQPISILEAMIAGLPIVVSDVGCIAETVGDDGVAGFIIKPGDIEQLAARLVLLLNDEALRARMGRAARERVLTHYQMEMTMERLRAVFVEVLAEDRM